MLTIQSNTSDKEEDWAGFLKELDEIEKSEVQDVCGYKNVQVYPQICPNLERLKPIDLEIASSAERSYINKLISSTLVETNEADIELLRSDPSHPLHSVTNFADLELDPRLLKGIALLGYFKPSAIQEKALPFLIQQRRNMIAQSQSGTGKTATFLLAALSRIEPSLMHCQCLCMAPTRELASQIASFASGMAQFFEGLTVCTAVRDKIPEVTREGFIRSQLVIGTPGTIFAWSKCVGHNKINPKLIRAFILDEADVMMENDDFLNISKRVIEKLPKDCQILLFSTTYDEKVIDFARSIVPNPVEIRVRRNQLSLANIKQYYLLDPTPDIKYIHLCEIYGMFSVGQAIIFCSTRIEARWLEVKMMSDGHKVGLLSGDLELSAREDVIRSFRNGDFRVLITTNLCSRGLDIPQINLVINWSIPLTREHTADCETYLHRIGRSGRFGKEGLAITFVGPSDEVYLRKIENHFDITIPLLTNTAFENSDTLPN